MNLRTNLWRALFGLSVLVVVVSQVAAQGGPPWAGRGGGPGRGPGWAGPGGGMGRGPAWARQGGGPDGQFAPDRDVFHYLLQNHDQIRRDVKNTKDGVTTLTESDKPEIAVKIQEHVAAMAERVEERRPIHMRDPLFAEVFGHAEKIHLKYEKTAKGVRVVETSDDPYVVQLIQAHGGVVSLFVKNGFSEARTNHAVPGAQGRDATASNAGPVALTAGGPRAGCPLAATGHCPRAAAAQCPAGANCPWAKACPAGKDCPHAKDCPAGKNCPSAQSCPAGKACAACPNAAACPFSATNQAPPLPKPESK